MCAGRRGKYTSSPATESSTPWTPRPPSSLEDARGERAAVRQRVFAQGHWLPELHQVAVLVTVTNGFNEPCGHPARSRIGRTHGNKRGLIVKVNEALHHHALILSEDTWHTMTRPFSTSSSCLRSTYPLSEVMISSFTRHVSPNSPSSSADSAKRYAVTGRPILSATSRTLSRHRINSQARLAGTAVAPVSSSICFSASTVTVSTSDTT